MVHGAGQMAGLLASVMACRSEPGPESAFVVTTSDDPLIATLDDDVLLLAFESTSVADAFTLRMAVPVPVAVTFTVCVAVPLTGSVPMLQVMVVVPLHVPCVELAEKIETFA